MADVRLDFVLERAGWAHLDIDDGSDVRVIGNISYLSDALDDLLRMGIDIATDKGWSFAQLYHEPGSTIFVAETAWWQDGEWKRGARLSALLGGEYTDPEPTRRSVSEAPRDFVIEVGSRDELAHLFVDMAVRVLQDHGEDGYLKLWAGRRGYPNRALAALEAALNSPPAAAHDYGS